MQEQLEDPAQEARHLQRCINDLVSLLSLSAIWRGSEPTQIVETLLDVLLRMLTLDFAYGRLNEAFGAKTLEILRIAEGCKLYLSPEELRNILGSFFSADAHTLPRIRSRLGNEEASIFPVPLGINGEIGVLVVGSDRVVFPQKIESLLLSVAANQASIGLREGQLLREKQRVADELDRRVAERTMELAATNEALGKEIADRKLAEEALRGSEQSLRLILDGIAGLVAIMSATGEVEAVNRQVLNYFGKSVEEMKGWSTSDAVHPDDLPGVISAWTHSIETASNYDVDHRLRRADNVYRWFHARGLSLLDAEGRVVRWYVLLTDIDDRRQAEEAVRVSEVNLRRVIDTIPTLAWCNLPDGPNEFLSKPWHDYTGLSPEESHGWGWTVAFHPEDLPPLMEKWKRMLVSGESDEIAARLRRHDGVYRWFLIRAQAFRDESGNIVRWYGTSTDIEDRKHAEEALARSEAFLAEGQHLSRTGSFSWRVDSGKIIWSEQLYRIFAFEEGTTITMERIGGRIHPEDLHMLHDMTGRARKGVSDLQYEHRLLMPDNSVKHLHLIAHGRRDAAGQLEYIGAVQDVTQRRLSEEALSQARSELARVARVTSLGVLTASIAHEVNQPLSGIITNASTCLRMLDGKPPNLEGARETARRMIRDGHRAADVIARLRTLYSKKEPALESMDLNEAAREVTALSSTEIQRNGVTLRQELADDLPWAFGDRIQLQQVILNLLRNAADAMSTIDDRPRELLVRTERDEGNRVRLSVKDSGVGFTHQAADKIFEAFYTTKADGMGIGLSISRSIIEAHQGRIWATPNDGYGSTFAFSIPCQPRDSAETRIGVHRANR